MAAAIPFIGPLIGLGSSIWGGAKKGGAIEESGKILSGAGEKAANDILGEGERGSFDINAAANQAADQSLETGNANQQALIKSGEEGRNRILDALKGLDTYTGAGDEAIKRIMAGLGEGGEFSKTFDGSDFLNDKGVQYRIAQGKKTIENSAAARGLIGGNVVRALDEQTQNIASDEYGKAFDRFQTNRTNIINPLQKVADLGSTANAQRITGLTNAGTLDMEGNKNAADAIASGVKNAGVFRTDAANTSATLRGNAMLNAAGYRTDAASAKAAAEMGSTNAMLEALKSGGGSLTDIFKLFGKKKAGSSILSSISSNGDFGGET